MVSEVAGTTRDTIEEEMTIDDIRFRFVDTAGLRSTDDRLERMGMERTRRAIESAQIVIRMVEPEVKEVGTLPESEGKREIIVVNKIDRSGERNIPGAIYISAREGIGIDELCRALRSTVDTDGVYRGEAVVSNIRHYDALQRARESIVKAQDGLAGGISSELLSEELRMATDALGEITGEITSNEILQNIFSKFCIGK